MKIGVPREVHKGERRVAVSPGVAEKLTTLGFAIAVESGAGETADFTDEAYREAGAEIVADARALWAGADIVLKVRAPERHPRLGVDETELMREGSHLVSFLWPAQNPELLQRLAAKKATVLAMDCVPRLSRAQKLDALSSMANIAGCRAVIEAAHHFGRFFAGQITAAGKVPPARVFVIGAGVAGLAAIGTATCLGAVVRANDTRPECQAADPLHVPEEMDLLQPHGGDPCSRADVQDRAAGSGAVGDELPGEGVRRELCQFVHPHRRGHEGDVVDDRAGNADLEVAAARAGTPEPAPVSTPERASGTTAGFGP